MKKQLLTLFLVILLVCSSFTACGDDATLQAVIMKDQPTKTEYVIGETFDFAGATLEVTLTDGTVKIVDVTAEMLSGSLTFTKAGKQAIAVIYTEGGVTKQAVIYVNVIDPATVVTPLAEAKENAKAELKAAYEALILTTPSGKNALGEDYPALTEDLATPAKAAYDAAVAAIDAAANVAAVNEAKMAGVAKLNGLDTYVDFYAAETAARLRADFDVTYVPDRLFWINYAELRYNMEVLSARIMRADSLDAIDALVALEEEIYENAENTVDNFAQLLVSFSKWQLDLPTDEALDEEDADLAIFFEIQDRIEILLDPDKTDEAYAKEFIKRISKYPSTGLYDVSDSIVDGIWDVLEAHYDADAETYCMFDWDFDSNGMTPPPASVAFQVVVEAMVIFQARDEADATNGVEDVVLAAIAAAEAEAAAGGLIYDPDNATSVYNQVKAAKALFDEWVADYGVADYNYELVEGYDKLNALATAYENIKAAIDAADAPTLTGIPTVIILNDTVKGEIEAVEAVANEYAESKGIPVDARYVNAAGETVYVIGNMETLWTARNRYDQLQDAKDAANAVANADTGATDGIATVIINTITGKTVVYANETATEGAVTHKVVDATKVIYDAFLAEYEIDTFAFDGTTVDDATTIAANLDAIFGADNIDAFEAAVARSAQLATAKSKSLLVMMSIKNIPVQPLILDRQANLATATTAYENWKTTYELDDDNAFDLESIKNILVIGDQNYYTIYTENKAEIDAAVAKLNALIESLKALKAPANIVASDRQTVADLRVAFEELVVLNGDESTNKAATAKHVVWLDADGVTEIDGYDKLCRAEATLFAIDYVAGLTAEGGYNNTIKAMRDSYLSAIGAAAGRADDALAINTTYSQAIAYISQNGGHDSFVEGLYDYETVVARIKDGEALVDITAEVVEALDELVAPDGEVETAFRLAARYVVTEENGVYNMTVYLPAVYDAASILSVTGVTPETYGTITVRNMISGATAILVGFEAENIVYDKAPGDALTTFAVTYSQMVLQDVKADVVTINDMVVLVVAADSEVAQIVANSDAGVDYAPTADIAVSSFKMFEMKALNAKVILTAKVSEYLVVQAKNIEAVIGYGQKLEDFAEGFGECDFYFETTDATDSKLGVVVLDGMQEFLNLNNANTDPDATGIITDTDYTDFDWEKVEFEWEIEWTEPVQPW